MLVDVICKEDLQVGSELDSFINDKISGIMNANFSIYFDVYLYEKYNLTSKQFEEIIKAHFPENYL